MIWSMDIHVYTGNARTKFNASENSIDSGQPVQSSGAALGQKIFTIGPFSAYPIPVWL